MHFQPEENVPAERISEDQMQAVIRLWQREQEAQGGLHAGPRVEDVAEGLSISTEEAVRLLKQVRQGEAGRSADVAGWRLPPPSAQEAAFVDAQEACIAAEHQRFARRMLWLMSGAALIALLVSQIH